MKILKVPNRPTQGFSSPSLRRTAQVARYGASVTTAPTNGKHLRHTFRLGDRQVFVISGFSPHTAPGASIGT